MGQLDRRLVSLERVAACRPSPDRPVVRAALARLTIGELETLEGALVAEEAGRPLTSAQEAARTAWALAWDAEQGARPWAS